MTILKAFRLPAGLVNKLSLLAKSTHRSERFYVEHRFSQSPYSS